MKHTEDYKQEQDAILQEKAQLDAGHALQRREIVMHFNGCRQFLKIKP